MDAQTLLLALQVAGLPVTGVCVIDPADPATWRFDGVLTDAQRKAATLTVQAQLIASGTPPIPVTLGPTLDQVIAWQAAKLGMSVDQAFTEIAAQPTVSARGT